MTKLARCLLAFSLLFVLLSKAQSSFGCGPFTLEPIFTFTVHPEYPLEKFAQGEIGVVQPTFARSYLYVVYRTLTGAHFSETEQKELVRLWRERLELTWAADGSDWIETWLKARKKVPGLSEPPKIDVYRNREKPNEYESYLNCQKDTFETAATTLLARMERFGANSTIVKEWVTAQDTVFANCSGGRQLPTEAPPEADEIVKADRTYQMAATNFYSGSFAEARRLFESIASDRNSPWQRFAPYLIARTLVRQASLGPPEGKNGTLAEAEQRLEAVLQSSAQQSSHAAARRLLSVVRLRLYPERRLQELAISLLHPNNENLKQELWDYTLLLDSFLGEDEDAREIPIRLRSDELTDWLVTFQSSSPTARNHALEQWHSKATLPWLLAALVKAGPDQAETVELLAAAAKIKPTSPLFASASFHSVRLRMELSHFAEARRMIDELLDKHRRQFGASGVNLLLGLRMRLAESLDDFLLHAQRVPAGASWNDDGREIPAPASEQPDEAKALEGKTLFDLDATKVLNREFPLSLLSQSARSKVLPIHLQRDVAQAAWVRAVLLGNLDTADTLTPVLKNLYPKLGPFLDTFQSAKSQDAKQFAAIYTWLKVPGLEPIVDAGFGRETDLVEQDPLRDNWWCGAAFPETIATGPDQPEDDANKQKVPQFLTPFLTLTERKLGEKEFHTLAALGAAPNYLCRQVIQWANKNAGDPRVPEALHLAVKTTRYGCTDKQTARWSKAAFDLLHKRYPKSEWTKRTPYWFKD